jgi:3'(2'), 5'-bisphosphate nucleotidase
MNKEFLNKIARKAGEIALQYYENNNVTYKKDGSPVTDADIAVDDYLQFELSQFSYDILSEERSDLPKTDIFWIIDPIDGTKGFVNKTGEFAVNISLHGPNNNNYMGAVYSPTKDISYCYDEMGAYKNDTPIRIKNNKEKVAVVSRTNFNDETKLLLDCYNVVHTIHISSSLKFGVVAEGIADYYIRSNPIMAWDTCAGVGLVIAAGGKVINIDGTEFSYIDDNFISKPFICGGL